jgi:hypothetical protein
LRGFSVSTSSNVDRAFELTAYFLILSADELLAEKEKYKGISEELDGTFAELAGY